MAEAAGRDLTPRELAAELAGGDPPLLVDIRERWEWEICRLEDATWLPMGELLARLGELDAARPWLFYCHHGIRSRQVVAFLRANGFPGACDLLGGLEAWRREVAPEMPGY